MAPERARALVVQTRARKARGRLGRCQVLACARGSLPVGALRRPLAAGLAWAAAPQRRALRPPCQGPRSPGARPSLGKQRPAGVALQASTREAWASAEMAIPFHAVTTWYGGGAGSCVDGQAQAKQGWQPVGHTPRRPALSSRCGRGRFSRAANRASRHSASSTSVSSSLRSASCAVCASDCIAKKGVGGQAKWAGQPATAPPSAP